ncbi:hypothetical protein [Promicromonospora iranensis]|uniref:hypothetical protein n=1 Tax=Promicromonospora iranensis TaxID=1105144 RepID=UPI0023A9BC1D|nr:hypothetical protein [Promicromonospora iranensis]
MSLSTAVFVLDEIETSICRHYGELTEHPGYTRTSGADGEYLAVVDHPALPGALESTMFRVCRGAAVDLADTWAFFDDLAPAAAFSRAGRMSNLRPSWDLFEAAEVRAPCPEHHREEVALLLGRQVYERSEIHAHAARFAGAAAARAHVAGWSES